MRINEILINLKDQVGNLIFSIINQSKVQYDYYGIISIFAYYLSKK